MASSLEIKLNAILHEKITKIIPENIKEGVTAFGVEGGAKTTSAKITNGAYLFYMGYRTDYMTEILGLCGSLSSMSYMFYYDTEIKEINLSGIDTSNATNMSSIFYSCRNLTSLDMSDCDMGSMENIRYAFDNCSNLTELKFGINLGKNFTWKTANYSNYGLNLSSCTKLTYESLINVINNLYDLNLTCDVANGGTLYRQSLVLGSTNLAKLTEEEIAIATNKGWDIS